MKHIKLFEEFMNENIDKKLSYKEFVETLRGNDKINTYTGKTTTGMEMFYLPTGHSYLGKKFTYKNKQKAYKEYLSTFIMAENSDINEGQFSWMTQDTGNQIGSEKQNTITVYMFSDKGEKWEEKRYEGYGEFGGKDYYELLAQMNGVENADRQDGIDIAFKKKVKGKVLFPALVQDPKFNWKRHDFTQEPESDPNQSWYKERSRGFF